MNGILLFIEINFVVAILAFTSPARTETIVDNRQARVIQAVAFDFDDTLMYTNAKNYIYNKIDDSEIAISTQEFAEVRGMLGQPGPFKDYEIRANDRDKTYRDFLSQGDKKVFTEIIRSTVKNQNQLEWKGPAWDIFVKSLSDPNSMPWVSIVTARGHNLDDFKSGFEYLETNGYIKNIPKAENIFAVNSPEWRRYGLKTEKLKVLALSKILDRFEEEISRKQSNGEYVRGEFIFIDDDKKNYEVALNDLSEMMYRWPHISIYVSYVGIYHKDLIPVTVKVEPASAQLIRCEDIFI